jgi:hypothetical protein
MSRMPLYCVCLLGLVCAGVLSGAASAPQASDLIAKARALRSYRCRLSSLKRRRLKVEGDKPVWVDKAFVADISCRTPDRRVWHGRSIPPAQAAAKVRELQPDQLPDAGCILPGHVWISLNRPRQVIHIDLQKEGVKETDVRAASLLSALGCDPVPWLLRIEPDTAKTVETKIESAEGGKPETLYVIEGTPRVPLGRSAFDKDAERSLRIVVGEDGFPRHVRAVGYTPLYDVVEFTVTDYELNPDLPDDLFEFTPPPGVKVIEADPSNWK